MKKEWRLSTEESHALFLALWENGGNPRLKIYAGFSNLALWLETFKGGSPLVVAPAEVDEEFFPVLVEQEIIRLAAFGPDDKLPMCGCEVFAHRRVLQQFRLKNF